MRPLYGIGSTSASCPPNRDPTSSSTPAHLQGIHSRALLLYQVRNLHLCLPCMLQDAEALRGDLGAEALDTILKEPSLVTQRIQDGDLEIPEHTTVWTDRYRSPSPILRPRTPYPISLPGTCNRAWSSRHLEGLPTRLFRRFMVGSPRPTAGTLGSQPFPDLSPED